jgi:hypothetical protein
MRDYTIPKMSPRKRRAMRKVLKELSRYRGGVVRKGRHQLWLAVVELEKLSRRIWRSTVHTIQPYKLDRPADSQWFKLLWASRNDSPNVPIEDPTGRGDPTKLWERGPADKRLALAWASKLKETLENWLAQDKEN